MPSRGGWAHWAVQLGLAQEAELLQISGGWQEWAGDTGGVFMYANGEVLAKK